MFHDHLLEWHHHLGDVDVDDDGDDYQKSCLDLEDIHQDYSFDQMNNHFLFFLKPFFMRLLDKDIGITWKPAVSLVSSLPGERSKVLCLEASCSGLYVLLGNSDLSAGVFYISITWVFNSQMYIITFRLSP